MENNIFTDNKKKRNNGLKVFAGAALLVGGIVLCSSCCCSEAKKVKGEDVKVTTTVTTIAPTTTIAETLPVAEKVDDSDYKHIYLTKAEFILNASNLADYLNLKGNSNAKPVDVMSLYYIANMDSVSNELFEELVNEGYLPETGTDIIVSSFGPAVDLRDYISLNTIEGKEVDFDYSKLFVNKAVADTFNESHNNLIKMAKITDSDEVTKIMEKQNNYILGETTFDTNNTITKEFGNLTAGQQYIYHSIQTKSYDIVGDKRGVSVGGQARINQKDDISNIVMSLEKEFACLNENENGKAKTLTK